MGLFDNLRNVARGWSQMVQDANAAAQAAEAAAPLEILDPTPQSEIDRLLAAGGIARGVVVGASHAPMSDGERVERMRVTVRVRGRLAGGGLGDEATITIWTSWKVAALLDRGLEIPVTIDRGSGVVTDIPADELRDELAPRFDESAKRRPGWGSDYF